MQAIQSAPQAQQLCLRFWKTLQVCKRKQPVMVLPSSVFLHADVVQWKTVVMNQWGALGM